MPEALARSHHDFVLSRPARRSAAPALRRLRALGRGAATIPARAYAGAFLGALLCGIVVNALMFQHERHPAPFFSPAKAAPDQPLAPAAPPAPPIEPIAHSPAAPARPTAAAPDAANSHAGDAIGALLGGDDEANRQRLIGAAQTELIRLGYALKANGVLGATTLLALHEFEKAHSLTISAEVTPRLLKQLAAAAPR